MHDCPVSATYESLELDPIPRLTKEPILESRSKVQARVGEVGRQDAGRMVWLYLGSSIHLGRMRSILYLSFGRVGLRECQTQVDHKGLTVVSIRVK